MDTRMAPLVISFLLMCTLLATVSGQPSVVSTNTITAGGLFSVYCDASRAGIQNVNYVLTLSIYRMTAADRNYSLIAQYNSLTPAGVNTDVKNIPTGRTWNITFSGGNNGVNNRDSMKIVMDVNDTMCGDAGMYRCRVVYFTATNIFQDINATDQNVTASTGLSGIRLAADPDMNAYSVGDNVTFTCSAVGPAANVNFRWELWADNSFGIEQSQPLPSSNEQTNNLPTPQTGNTGCAQFNWVATLTIQVPGGYEQQAYKCIVTYLQQELSGNLTIGTTGLKPQPDATSSAGTGPDVGMIVGIVIGCIAAIAIVIIIVFIIRYRKRSQENRSGDKDQHDAPTDANLHAPPPVFYPPSKQSKAAKEEKDAKIPTGMTNEALDTSYDSRDSVSKGPPRYANAEIDTQGPPRYEKETHRGRNNKGYDEEDRDRNGGHGRRQPREREERKHRSRDYDDDEPRRRNYTTDDGTDSRVDMGDPNMGTSI